MGKKVKIAKGFEGYYTHSKILSDITRYLGYSILAAVFFIILGQPKFYSEFITSVKICLGFALTTVIFDFLQYLLSTIRWYFFSAKCEKENRSHDDEENVSDNFIYCLIDFFFWGKIFTIFLAVVLIIILFWNLVDFIPLQK